MPRVPLAVIERIKKRYAGQRRTTLINLWIGIRRLLLCMSKIKGNMLGVREIAEWSGVSRSRLCGDKGYIQNLLDIGVIGVTIIDDQPLLKDRYNGRALYEIDMAALEKESLVLLRTQFREKSQVPRRSPDPRQGSLLDYANIVVAPQAAGSATASPAPSSGAASLHEQEPAPAPAGAVMVSPGATMVPLGATGKAHSEPLMTPSGAAMVSNGTTAAPSGVVAVSFEADSGPLDATVYTHQDPMGGMVTPSVPAAAPSGAVGMDGIGMDGKGGEGGGRPLTQRETIQIVHTAIQQALTPAIQQVLATLSEAQQIGAVPVMRGPDAPKGEPTVQRWPKELWSLYKRGECDPLELERLDLLPSLFDGPSGGYGAYWVSRAILLLSERPAPVTLPYLRGVLERMRRAGEWSTAQLEAPAEEHERAPSPGRERGRAAPAQPPPSQAVVSASAAHAMPAAPVGERTALSIFRQHAGSTRLLPEQERQITERARDLEVWEVVCSYWREKGHGFLSIDKMLHRYASLMEERIKAQPATDPKRSKFEREIHEIPGLSDEEKERYCAEMLQYGPDDRKRFVEDLRRRCAAKAGEGVPS